MVSLTKRLLIGKPIATSEEGHQRLRKRVALPIFASDAMSSTAYATDEILIVLLIQAGVGALAFDRLVPLAIIVAVLLVHRHPLVPPDDLRLSVRRRRLHRRPRTTSARLRRWSPGRRCSPTTSSPSPCRSPAECWRCSRPSTSTARCASRCVSAIIAVITVANLRGLRESGALFAPPTYLYIVMLGVLIVVGLYRVFFRDLGPIPLSELSEEAQELANGTQGAQPVHAPAGVLVGRRRPVGRRGGVQRRADVPQAGEPQRLD